MSCYLQVLGSAMADGSLSDDRAELRSLLIAMRAELVERLTRDKIEAGTLALLAGINAAIEATKAPAEALRDRVEHRHAVLADDGEANRLAIYNDAGAVAVVMLDPVCAIGLAAKLIAAAPPKLGSR
jgi:hypothetical protein